MLGAIETNILTSFPGGVFNKGFVRAYARQVGLDEKRPYPTIWRLRESQFNPKPSCPAFAIPPAGPRLMPRKTLKQFALKQFAAIPC